MGNYKQELINTWIRNQQANEQILDEVNEQAATLTPKAIKAIYGEFAHIHSIRYYNIEKQDKKYLTEIMKLSLKDKLDEDLIKEQLKLSNQAIIDIIEYKDDLHKVKSYKNGIIGWIVYLINHEAHHRSKAIMIMKNEGIQFSKRIKFDFWNWK